MAGLLYLCVLASMVAKPVVPLTTTKPPYLVAEDNEEKKLDSCTVIMANNGLNFSSFSVGAAHGIHSLYLEDIREYFEPEATVENKIPVINSNLSTEQTILFNAPLAGYDEDFQTTALKVMSFYMRHDNSDFAIKGLNTLEKLSHQYHMHALWKAAAPIYQKMKESPPKDTELCSCVNDITANGILIGLVNINKKFNSKRQTKGLFNTYYTCGGCHITGKGRTGLEEATPEQISQYEEEYLADSTQENAERLMSVKPWQKNSLVGPKQWASYEAMLRSSMMTDKKLNDFATFMYCKLNQP